MYFRCTSCLAATWIGSDRPPAASESVVCHECGRAYTADPVRELGSTEGSHYRHASAFARSERLDMATAYSFLLGLIGREELTVVEDFQIDEQPLDQEEILLIESLQMESPGPEDPARASTPDAPPAFDPGFQKAVVRGRLTIEEALRRGDRTAYATNLSQRYKLTKDLALAVADNRITLFQARKRQEARPAPEPQPVTASTGGGGMKLALACVTVAAILGLSWGIWKRDREPRQQTEPVREERSGTADTQDGSEVAAGRPAAAPSPLPSSVSTYSSTQVLTDAKGRVTRIEALDADTVLHAFCGADGGSMTCEPLGILDTVPPALEIRLGTFRDPESPDEIRAIRIVRDRFSRRWTAGDGEQPIPLTDPPPASGSSRVADRKH